MNTELLTIIDASGSMANLRDETVSGYNGFIAEQRQVPGACRVSLVTFSATVTPVYSARPLEVVTPLVPGDYLPHGFTALHDAIGSTLHREGARIAREKWAGNVIVCIITDGEENASRHYGQAEVRRLIEHAQRYGWHFVYLAANVDAFATGRGMGIAEKYTAGFTANAAGTSAMYGAVSATTRSLRAAPDDADKGWVRL
jgi:Mg-chelatase subunit ChlD